MDYLLPFLPASYLKSTPRSDLLTNALNRASARRRRSGGSRRRERRTGTGGNPKPTPPSGSAGGGERAGPEARTGARARSGEANPCARPQRTAQSAKAPGATRGKRERGEHDRQGCQARDGAKHGGTGVGIAPEVFRVWRPRRERAATQGCARFPVVGERGSADSDSAARSPARSDRSGTREETRQKGFNEGV